MPVPLLQTKLFIPLPKPDLVPRPHLIERVENALQQGVRLLLVSAPAGYGKSTLLGEWARQQDDAPGSAGVSWLSLDEEDNDEVLFWRYVVAALQETEPALGRGTDSYLQSQPIPVRGLLTHLLNQAAALPPAPGRQGQIVLVIDDYHLINNPTIHEGVAFLLEHLPPRLQLIILTRADPPLPVARMRARGEAFSLRANALRFGGDEVRDFLNETKALELSAEQVAALEQRTEGWIAGLQMAALALQSIISAQDDISGRGHSVASFVDEFSGMQRYILDYLLEEILTRQPEPVQNFLLYTSILDRFCAQLASALYDEGELESVPQQLGGEHDTAMPAAAVLDSLDRANLFIIPLDQQRKWYRYHHLFADLLQARLHQQLPQQLPDLHRRAAQWYAGEGLATEAINHAVKAGDNALAADLMERHTRPLIVRGEIQSLLRSIRELPESVVEQRPWLAIYQGWALTLGGHYGEAATIIAHVEREVQAAPPPATETGDQVELEGHIAAMRAFQTATTMVGEQAVAYAQQALELLPPDAHWPRGLAEWSLGYAHRMSGRLAEAAPHFVEVVRIGRAQGDLQAIASAQYDLAMVRRQQGRLRQAQTLFEEVLSLAAARDAADLGYLGRVEAGLAGALLQQNRLQEARRHVERSLQLNENWQNPNHDQRTYLVLAELELGEGNLAAARAALRHADAVQQEFSLVPVLLDRTHAVRARLWLKEQNLQTAARWLKDEGGKVAALTSRGQPGAAAEQTTLAALRLQLVLAGKEGRQQIEAAEQALDSLLGWSKSLGHGETTIAALVLLALSGNLLGDQAKAYTALEESLLMAAPEGFLRIFLDEGQLLHNLLVELEPSLRARQPENRHLQQFLHSLLAAFAEAGSAAGAGSATSRSAAPSTAADHALVEPLTERELEVVVLLAQGLTNQQIADRLIIARGTVKAHAASIYRKLDVHNRTHAVTRARELNLI